MNDLRFAGYAAIFNRIDKGGDIIRPGAFGSLKAGLELPLLWQHDPNECIGNITYAAEDRRGLRVIGTVLKATRIGRLVATDLTNGALNGLSFGYRVNQSTGQKPRILKDLDVAEISLVTFPMQTAATIHRFE